MKITRLGPDDRERWDRFVDNHPESLLGHRFEWGKIFAECFRHKPYWLCAGDGDDVLGILPLAAVDGLIGGKALVSLPWLDGAGPLARSSDVADALMKESSLLASEIDAAYLEVRATSCYRSPRPVLQSKTLMQLDLHDPELMWKAFSAKVRNQVRKAEKEGLVASVGGVELLDEFYSVFSRNMRDIGVPVWGKSFFRTILERFEKSARLIAVRESGRPVGGGLLLLHGKGAIVPSASSLRTHFKKCPNHLLYWTALKESFSMGAGFFDFGRSSPDSGTHRFKKQWGCREVPCFWHYDLRKLEEPPERNTGSAKLKLAVETWKRLPLPIANTLGPLLVRRIP